MDLPRPSAAVGHRVLRALAEKRASGTPQSENTQQRAAALCVRRRRRPFGLVVDRLVLHAQWTCPPEAIRDAKEVHRTAHEWLRRLYADRPRHVVQAARLRR